MYEEKYCINITLFSLNYNFFCKLKNHLKL